MEMKASKVLNKLRANEIVSCMKLNSSDYRIAELAAMSGFDCLWVDMEHVPNSIDVVEHHILAAKANDTDIMVRVARGSYSDHVRALEAGATGIMVPHVMGLQDAKNVVRMTRFHPVGRRPVDGGNADGGYCLIPFTDYIQQANERRFVVIQIEDPEPMQELDAICALDGIDMIFFGPGDFSHGIGDPGNFNNPELLRARKLVAEAARKNGKFAGTTASVANIKELRDMGYQFIACGADVLGLAEYFASVVKAYPKSN
jgi:4-hydroxy-2-oxoheptanedioate aldolase